MEIKIKAVLFESPDNIKILLINVNSSNYIKIRKKIELEKKKMIDYLNHLLEIKQIKSVFKPRNKSIQYQLDNIVKSKKIANNSINTIKTIFY